MPSTVTTPTPTIQQVAGLLPDGSPMLAVLARRTYTLDGRGALAVADEQAPLVVEPKMDPDIPVLMLADNDLVPFKLRTDVIVHGHVHGHGQVSRLDAVVRVGAHERRIAAFGERRCSLGPRGVVIGEPAPFDRVALTWQNAYGGRDHAAEDRYGNPWKDLPPDRGMAGIDLDAVSPWLYPRNPLGRGYLVEATADAVERLQLPQLEDPTDLLTSARIAAGDNHLWHRMPLPHATGWVDYSWYPRIAFLGVVPIAPCFDEPPLEVVRGLVPDYLSDGTGRMVLPDSGFDLVSGAPAGQQVPWLRGGEAVELHHMHRTRARWRVSVPPAPRIHTDGRKGRMNEAAEVVVQSLILEPDEDRVTVVWRGCGPAIRRYAPQELANMPLRVEWRD